MRRNNYFMIVALLLIVGIGYAALSSNLGIRGLGSYKSNTWDVYLDNLIDNSAYSEVVSQASINEDKDSISFQVNLDDFEDKYIFYTDVVNNGTIDAMIDNLEVNGLSNEVKKFIDIKVTYKDGIAVNRYDLLKENSRDTLKVECSYKENVDITDLPDTDGSTSLTITIDYVLADVNAREREHGEGDVNAPVITLANSDIKQGINGWVNRADFTYRVEDKDAIKSFKYCVSTEECNPNIEATLQDNEFNYSFGTSNQSQLICVEAVDIFGNTTKECSDSYLVDVDEPEITSFEATASNNTISVEVTASDSLSGVVKYYYSKDSGNNYVASDYSNYTFTNLDDGNYNIMTYVEDEAGNIKKTEYKQVEVKYHAVYAILYDDGTLALNSTGSVNENKTVVSNYGKIYNYYTYWWDIPWHNNDNNITTIDIEDVIRPLKTSEWFLNNSNLTEVKHIENLDTSSVTNMSSMFSGCTSLTTLDVSNWNTSNVTNMSHMFSNATSLITLDVSNWDVSNVTTMSYMFYECKNLTTLDVSKWNTESVTDLSWVFYQCSNLTTIDVSNWDVSSATNMVNMFYGCTNLTTLNVSNWNTSNVTKMNGMFYNCSNITTVDVSNWDVSSVTEIFSMFNGCSNLTNLDVSNWDVSNVTTMNSMFNLAMKLEGLDLSKWDTRNVTNFNSMFLGTSVNATSKVWYYGPNSTNIYDNISSTTGTQLTYVYKSN